MDLSYHYSLKNDCPKQTALHKWIIKLGVVVSFVGAFLFCYKYVTSGYINYQNLISGIGLFISGLLYLIYVLNGFRPLVNPYLSIENGVLREKLNPSKAERQFNIAEVRQAVIFQQMITFQVGTEKVISIDAKEIRNKVKREELLRKVMEYFPS